ncbi:hypothetical protein PG608_02660 [Riemerella anatipestifer]|nr:hypothetical protein [Riemerella anatipestifer]MDY3518113.1 hypothetical protein [Riemerella anatipestifer]MDY3543099.1 hypothetical protein [Riemerella anatipestifer]
MSMKFKILMVYGLLFSTVLWVNAQSKYTPQQVEASDDIKVIANFIKYNPDHPDTPKFKAKLYNILNGNTSNDSKKKTASTPVVVEKKSSSKTTSSIKNNSSKTENEKAADMINHLLGDTPNENEAYFSVRNKSKCPIILKISDGKKTLELNIPASGRNATLLQKGTYQFSSTICNAQFSTSKKVTDDMEMVLGN